MMRDADGKLISVTMYYVSRVTLVMSSRQRSSDTKHCWQQDPVLDHNQPGGTEIGLGVAFYVLPQDRELAREMYEAWVDQNDLRSEDESVVTPEVVGRGQLSKLGLILAQEFVSSHICTLRRFQLRSGPQSGPCLLVVFELTDAHHTSGRGTSSSPRVSARPLSRSLKAKSLATASSDSSRI